MASSKRPDTFFSVTSLAAKLRNELNVSADAPLTVALSGGLDSTVLLHALAGMRREVPFELSAIHIDHGLHPESALWAALCTRICRSLDVPLQVQRVNVDLAGGSGPEAAARHARYHAIATLLAPGACLVTAHHSNDQAETVLLRLFRGTGVAGLVGMMQQTQLFNMTILRPLLDVSRAALEDYARVNNLQWIDDPSNRVCDFRRNFLRSEIIPRLENYWPDMQFRVSQTARHATDAQEILDELAAEDMERYRVNKKGCSLNVNDFHSLTEARQRNLLRYWLRCQSFSMPDARQLLEIQSMAMNTTRSQHACVRIGSYEIWRYRNALTAIPVLPIPPKTLDVEWDPLSLIEINGVGQLRADQALGQGVAISRLRGNFLRIRVRQGGEQLQLPGRRHHHQLKKLLQAAGIPPWERARLPLLFCGQDLVAVADRWVCRDFASASTEPGLRIVWEPVPGQQHRP